MFFHVPLCFPVILQAEENGISALMVGVILGCTPLILAVLSPVMGYLVSINNTGILKRWCSHGGTVVAVALAMRGGWMSYTHKLSCVAKLLK